MQSRKMENENENYNATTAYSDSIFATLWLLFLPLSLEGKNGKEPEK